MIIAPPQKRFTTHRAVFPHAAWLDQPSGHCPIFLTAASRRSLDRVSVPMWGTFLSEPLAIVGTVGRYPAVYLMAREPIRMQSNLSTSPHAGKCVTGYYASFPMTIPHIRARCSRVTHPFAGRRHVLLHPLPLDLHVLSLPLAFILSQDQTLHCIFYINLACPRHLFL